MMSTEGRTVRIFLVDGTPSGVMTAEIMNWTGRFTVAPRSQLSDLSLRQEVKRSGIYILSGEDPKDPTQEVVYIGESDNVWDRLVNHNRDPKKDFWRRTVIVTSKDENLTKAHTRYLESRLIQVTSGANRVQLANNTNPEFSSLPEPDVADMEYFLNQVQMLLPVVGFNFAISLPSLDQPDDTFTVHKESPIFKLTYGGVEAYAQEIGDEFVVFQGSTARKRTTRTLADLYIQMRQKLLKEGKLDESSDEKFWTFTQNVPFSSTSTAANVVGGAQLNGRTNWKIKDTNKIYAEWQESQTD
jgi:hypothetical protein